MIVRSLDKFHLVVRQAFLFLLFVKMSVQNYNSCQISKVSASSFSDKPGVVVT